MRGDILNHIPGVTVSGGLYGVWWYTLDIGPVEMNYTNNVNPPKLINWFCRSKWVWLYVRVWRFVMIVWKRGMRPHHDEPR